MKNSGHNMSRITLYSFSDLPPKDQKISKAIYGVLYFPK